MDRARPDVIGCSLPTADLAARRQRWERLRARAGAGVRTVDGGVELVFRPLDGVVEELSALAQLEGACCPFALWEPREEPAAVVLAVTAEGDAVAIVRDMFA